MKKLILAAAASSKETAGQLTPPYCRLDSLPACPLFARFERF
jgi:hypothetical protein